MFSNAAMGCGDRSTKDRTGHPALGSGLGVIADNVIHIGTHLAEQTRPREVPS